MKISGHHVTSSPWAPVTSGVESRGGIRTLVFPAELEAEQKDYVILPPAAVTLIKISA